MPVFWTSDLHFGHKNIMKYCSRPWKDIDEMDNVLIERWNERVSPQDEVYFLGDFTLGRKPAECGPLVERLQGKKYWALGNHDTPKVVTAIKNYFVEITPGFFEKNINGVYMVMCHYPLLRWNHSAHGSWMLHGHSHGQLTYPFQGKICDVSADAWNWYPVSFDEVKAKLEEKPVVFETDRM